MTKKCSRIHGALFLLMVCISTYARAQNTIDIETGLVFTHYNDVAIPNNQSNRFSLKNDLIPNSEPFVRIRYGYQIDEKHWVGFLFAPLTIHSKGVFDKNINFQNKLYKSGEQIDATYRFNSYRFLYRYTLHQAGKNTFSLGMALKIRDAKISLNTHTTQTSKENLGFVPLISFNYTHHFTDRYAAVIEGEGLIAPQGRAEDIFIGGHYKINNYAELKAGYRVLEGGADNEKLYTFSMFNYATLGVIFKF